MEAGPVIPSALIQVLAIVAVVVAVIAGVAAVHVFARCGWLWIQAAMSHADVSLISLIGMSFRQVNPSAIVAAKIMGAQAGLDIDRQLGMSTAQLEAHVLAGGDVRLVLQAIIAARSAGINLDFHRAAGMDLAGRDVLDAVRTSVVPKVIDCPGLNSGATTISAIAKNGVELRVRARVTVRTNIDQLIGGATEETVIARVCQGIISTIGSAASHMEVLQAPGSVSARLLTSGLDSNTAFEIISIDMAEMNVGQNIGARLQCDQAEADTRVAQARAAGRQAEAVAWGQEMRARAAASRAALVLAEAEIPAALAFAFRSGTLHEARRTGPEGRNWPRTMRAAGREHSGPRMSRIGWRVGPA
ncbi:MAG: flotillin-like FloA family protein [Pirellulaceae bacterium]